MNLCKCPSCGHKHRVADERLGKKIRCVACDEMFTAKPSKRIKESAAPASGAEASEDLGRQLVTKTLGDPARVLDGAILGAISGVLAGWLRRVRQEGRPPPSPELVAPARSTILPVLRHENDLVATAKRRMP